MSVHPNKLLIATGQAAGADRAHIRYDKKIKNLVVTNFLLQGLELSFIANIAHYWCSGF